MFYPANINLTDIFIPKNKMDKEIAAQKLAENPDWLPKCVDELTLGPWTTEMREHPDKIEFEHAGFECKIERHPERFFLCGYIRVPQSHSLSGSKRDDLNAYINVHGGLTYKTGDGWYGFDCNHITSGDISPLDATIAATFPSDHVHHMLIASFEFERKHYWTIAEVKNMLMSAADDLAAVDNSENDISESDNAETESDSEPESDLDEDIMLPSFTQKLLLLQMIESLEKIVEHVKSVPPKSAAPASENGEEDK